MLLNKLYTEPFGYVPSFLKGRLSYIASEEYEMVKMLKSDITDFWKAKKEFFSFSKKEPTDASNQATVFF